MNELIALVFLIPALVCSGVVVACGAVESALGPDPRLDRAANAALIGVAACMLAWWYVAA